MEKTLNYYLPAFKKDPVKYMHGIPSDFHDEVMVKEFIGDKYYLVYLKKSIAEDQGNGLNERLLSHVTKNNGNSDVYGNAIITKVDGNMSEKSIKKVRRLLKEVDIGMDLDNYI